MSISKRAKPSWQELAKVLNAEGPCIKNANTWKTVNKRNYCSIYLYYLKICLKQWFSKYKLRLEKKIINGDEVTNLEQNVQLPKKRITKT